MKKVLATLFLAIFAISLVACKNDENEKNNEKYVYNGTFTAFKEGINYGSPQITWVSVTIEDGEIKGFNIDEIQSKDGNWNKKTKKQLKEDYNMKPVSPIDKEWYEQAEFLEDYFLKHGADIDYDGDGFPTDEGLLTGTTMVIDTYVELALEALLNWKEGKYSALNYSLNYGAYQYTWVDMYVKGDEIVKFNIDELQSGEDKENDNFHWNTKTKKALKEDYNMKPASPIGKEWYEQAYAIEQYFINESISSVLLDSKGYVQNIAGATMVADTYIKLAIQCVNNFKSPIVIK